jgi:hypothetical protein
MKVQDFLLQMKKTLADERMAIRSLDHKGVTQAALTKEALLKAVSDCPPDDRAELAAALKDLKQELRRNLVLLAHTRDYIRDAAAVVNANNGRRPRLQASL